MTYTNFWLQYYMRRRQSEGTTVSCSGCAAYDCPPCGTCEQEVGCLPCGTCDYETHPNQNFYHKLTFNTIQIPWTACSAIGGEGSVTGQWINDTGFVCGYFPAKIFTVTSSGGDCAGPDGCDGCSIWEYVQGGPGINNVSRLGMRQHAVWDKTPECADGSCLPLGQQCCSQQSACYCPSAGSSGCCPGEDVIDAGLYTALPSYSGVVNTQLYTRENAVYLKHVGDSCNVCVQPIVCSCEDYPGASSTYADCDGNREACNAPPEGFSFEIECLNAPDADTGCNTGRTIQMGGVGNPIVINLEIPAGSPSLYIAKLTANAIGSWPIECWTPEHGQSNCYGCEEDCTYRFPTDDCFSQAESTEVLFFGQVPPDNTSVISFYRVAQLWEGERSNTANCENISCFDTEECRNIGLADPDSQQGIFTSLYGWDTSGLDSIPHTTPADWNIPRSNMGNMGLIVSTATFDVPIDCSNYTPMTPFPTHPFFGTETCYNGQDPYDSDC